MDFQKNIYKRKNTNAETTLEDEAQVTLSQSEQK